MSLVYTQRHFFLCGIIWINNFIEIKTRLYAITLNKAKKDWDWCLILNIFTFLLYLILNLLNFNDDIVCSYVCVFFCEILLYSSFSFCKCARNPHFCFSSINVSFFSWKVCVCVKDWISCFDNLRRKLVKFFCVQFNVYLSLRSPF